MKIFVAKLSPSTSSESLQALFEQYGEVASSKVIMDRETGRSKCYGFVEMANDEEGKQALDTLNGVDYEGSTIATKEAIPHEDYQKGGGRPPRRFDGGQGGGGFNRGGQGGGGFNRGGQSGGGFNRGGQGGGGFRPRRDGDQGGFSRGGGRSEGGKFYGDNNF